MTAIPESQVDEWVDAITNLHAIALRDDAAHRIAYEAVANLWSGFGYQDAPPQVQQMLINALEAGYATALSNLRDGDLDDEIREWRPDLVDG